MTMHPTLCRLLFIPLFFISLKGHTENRLLLPSSQESIQFEQKQRLESELNQRQLLEKQNTLLLNDSSITPLQNEKCFPIDHIKLVDTTVLSRKTQSQIMTPYLTRCLTFSDIQKVAKHITNYYIEHGYITSQAIISEQDLSSHHLVLQMIEGKTETIEIEGSPKRLVHQIFPSQQRKNIKSTAY